MVSFSLQSFPGFSRQQSRRMREVDLGAHTIRSHGSNVAKKHKHDWVILVLLGIIVIILNVISPFHRYVSQQLMDDLKFPFKDNTVPTWSVPLFAVLLPIAIFVFFYFRRRDVYDLHHSLLGLFYAVLITAVITDAIKNATGRPRPNFYWRCFPDGKELYDDLGDVICHGKDSEVKEGYKSFPSGHASWAFAGLGFLSLYLAGKIKAFDEKGHVSKLCLVIFPLLGAALVAISRVDDYWHHWQDVFAGALLGLVVAALCYNQFFPAPYHEQGWGPYAYFRALEQSPPNTNEAGQRTNSLNSARAVDSRAVTLQLSQNRQGFASFDDIESGRR